MSTLAELNSVWSKDPVTTANNTPYPLIAHLLDTYISSSETDRRSLRLCAV